MKNLEFNLCDANEADAFAKTCAALYANGVKFTLLQDKCPNHVAIVLPLNN